MSKIIQTFVLQYKKTGQIRLYSTLSALCEENAPNDLGISKYTLDRIDWSIDVYENDLIHIQTLPRKRRQDILREREQFI